MNSDRPPFTGGDKTAGFTLQILPATEFTLQRFQVTIWGYWRDAAMLAQFKREVLACMTIMHRTGSWDVYGDLTNFPVQAKVMFELIQDLMGEATRKGYRRVAVVSGNIIAKMGIGRLANAVGLEIRFCDTLAEVETYLRESS